MFFHVLCDTTHFFVDVDEKICYVAFLTFFYSSSPSSLSPRLSHSHSCSASGAWEMVTAAAAERQTRKLIKCSSYQHTANVKIKWLRKLHQFFSFALFDFLSRLHTHTLAEREFALSWRKMKRIFNLMYYGSGEISTFSQLYGRSWSREKDAHTPNFFSSKQQLHWHEASMYMNKFSRV